MKKVVLAGLLVALCGCGAGGGGGPELEAVKGQVSQLLVGLPVQVVSFKHSGGETKGMLCRYKFEAVIQVDKPVGFDGANFRQWSAEEAAKAPRYADRTALRQVSPGQHTWRGNLEFLMDAEHKWNFEQNKLGSLD